MSVTLTLTASPTPISEAARFVHSPGEIQLGEDCLARVRASHSRFLALMEKNLPIYGVTTGFGASVKRPVEKRRSEELQKNLIDYLTCGTGQRLPREAVRAAMLFRLNSLTRGFSGVSTELVEQLRLFLEKDWTPLVPREGSLGASGDLVPLAYVAQALQGNGVVETKNGIEKTADVLARAGAKPYTLKAKEGLALVNGTSAMAGLALTNILAAEKLLELATHATAWTCLAIQGRTEAFGKVVNEQAKNFSGQALVAARVAALLDAEGYASAPLATLAATSDGKKMAPVQDKYSLRCAPQVLGPVLDTARLARDWLETELNGVSDNPLIGDEGELAMGGNFYGGYIGHGMDYLKICIGHVADLADRQLMLLMEEGTSRGLPPNLANWHDGNEDEHFLHHGLKGLNQSASAITSEILAKSIPNGIFSRSAESHNQDKVSLGMSAATQMLDMLPQAYNLISMHLICLAQALDLRGVRLKGEESRALYAQVRRHAPFVERDRPLDNAIMGLSKELQNAKA